MQNAINPMSPVHFNGFENLLLAVAEKGCAPSAGSVISMLSFNPRSVGQERGDFRLLR
jgi:hypothetical protein